MTDRTKKPGPGLANVLSGAKTDDEQLRALAREAQATVALPTDAFVVGESVEVVAIEYRANSRRGLTATCRRHDGQHTLSLADVAFSPGSVGAAFVAFYRTWLGLDDLTPSDGPQTRHHKADTDEIELGQPLDLIVLACKSNALRCRLPGSARELTLRTPVRDEVPGEIVTVLPSKKWTHARHPYLSGRVQSSRLDVPVLGLTPLELNPEGDWDPEEQYWGEEDEPIEDWAKPIIAGGKRPAFEFEQVIPGVAPDDLDIDTDPIIEASELNAAGYRSEARELLMGILAQDLRCLDAHAHLGNFEFGHRPAQALRHYSVGVGIGELTLGAGFDGVLSWGRIDNRPFLRCLHGVGISLWKLGNVADATEIFRRMLWLNPSDNQGARFGLAAVEDGRPWEDTNLDG